MHVWGARTAVLDLLVLKMLLIASVDSTYTDYQNIPHVDDL